jgi:hypothetical protein
MIFQTLDDKNECFGVYVDGKLHFDDMPTSLTKTWDYSGSLYDKNVEYAYLMASGKSIEDVCPDHLAEDWLKLKNKLRAYKKSFEIAKLNFREHCFYDLVPHDFLLKICETKNKITEHVFENYEKPENYSFMKDVQKLLFKIKHQNLNVNTDGGKNLFLNSVMRQEAKRLLNRAHYIDYNIFGTVTGRLTTRPSGFPILTIKKEFRKLIKPRNNWFLSLDYNGAEVRTLLALSGQGQPEIDIHEWNMQNVFEKPELNRSEAKTLFFAWLYNPDSKTIQTNYYDRKEVLDKYYKDGYINTVFNRHIQVDARKAFNYLIQSTTADLVLERAVAIDGMLEGKKSFISHIVHDEIVIDFADEDREMVTEIRDTFAQNRLGDFVVNLSAGKDYYDLNRMSI